MQKRSDVQNIYGRFRIAMPSSRYAFFNIGRSALSATAGMPAHSNATLSNPTSACGDSGSGVVQLGGRSVALRLVFPATGRQLCG